MTAEKLITNTGLFISRTRIANLAARFDGCALNFRNCSGREKRTPGENETDRRNPLEQYNESQFHQRYRVSKETFYAILKLIGHDFERRTRRSNPLNTIEQNLKISLRNQVKSNNYHFFTWFPKLFFKF